MTLTSAIEAAREAMTNATGWMHMKDKTFHVEKMEKALAALPDKPITENEIFEIIMACNKWNDGGLVLSNNARNIIRALKAANVLYCED